MLQCRNTGFRTISFRVRLNRVGLHPDAGEPIDSGVSLRLNNVVQSHDGQLEKIAVTG